MYRSKYKHKHAARRAKMFPEKVEDKGLTDIELTAARVNRRLQGLQAYDRQHDLASLAGPPQNQMAPNNSLGSLFGGAAFLGGLR